jgi:hypothetical protein
MPLTSTCEWLNSETKVMWNYQKPDGIIEGWHGDGNFARTTIMYCLWKTQGVLPGSWNENLKLGASGDKDGIKVAISCKSGWDGKIIFDSPRYRDKMHMPVDYPRINQFQQWFTVEKEKKYEITFFPKGNKKNYTGAELIDGLKLKIKPDQEILFTVKPV